MTNETLERLAEASHDIWSEGKKRDGWQFAPTTDKAAKLHASLVPYNELCEADKESNRDLIRGMSEILRRAGVNVSEVL